MEVGADTKKAKKKNELQLFQRGTPQRANSESAGRINERQRNHKEQAASSLTPETPTWPCNTESLRTRLLSFVF